MKHFLLLSVLLLLSACIMEEEYAFIDFYNDSMDTIAYLREQRVFNPDIPNMFDSLPNDNKDVKMVYPNCYYHDDIILPLSYIKNFPDRKMIIYILNYDTLRKYEWNVIRDSSYFIRRYKFSLDDLMNMDCTLRFP